MSAVKPDFSKQTDSMLTSFAAMAKHLVNLLHHEGLKTEAYLEGLPYFSALSLEQKSTALKHLQFYHDLCQDHVNEGQALRDSKKFTWRALVKMSLSPGAGFLNRIEDGDVVEIYSPEGVQIFRNLEFFDLCSYTIEELFCLEWWRLFHRDEKISNLIVKIVGELLNKQHPEGLTSPAPRHLVVEASSREKYHVDFVIKYIGPLYQNKRVNALICIEHGILTSAKV